MKNKELLINSILLITYLTMGVTAHTFKSTLSNYFGMFNQGKVVEQAPSDLNYNKMDFKSIDELEEYEKSLVREMGSEGYVLLKNDTSKELGLPLNKNSKVSLFSHSSVDLLAGGTGSGTGRVDGNLKDALKDAGFSVNLKLWDFYTNGKGSSYVRGDGSLFYGNYGEDWSINECPLSVLKQEPGLLESASDTTPIFVLSRTCGEGRDLARNMNMHTSVTKDKNNHYLELDTTEKEILEYLNSNFENVIVILNTNNAFELGWINEYKNIRSVLYAQGGGGEMASSIVDVLSGKTNPSGHLVDTFAYDEFSSPATLNYGDIEYTVNGKPTGYYGVSYDEGIYIGYKYYETRYYDKVTSQGNTLGYDYSKVVQFPFGYGLSYTDFKWSNFNAKIIDDSQIELTCNVKNVGNVGGKEVVQAYLNAPYTDFDKKNHIEKSATSLIGFTKTDYLLPNESQNISIIVNIDDFKTYDDVINKTYILEAGNYNLTLASNAHEATNNFLDLDNRSNEDLIVGNKDSSFVYTYKVNNDDVSTYSLSKNGTAITNLFDEANYINRDKYLTRNDWTNSYPKTHGKQDAKVISYYSEKNGYKYYEEISETQLDRLKAKGTLESANSPVDESTLKAGSYGKNNDVSLIDYRGLDYNEANWDLLVSTMSTEEVGKIVNQSGYETPAAESINKPRAIDLDGPMGLNITSTHEPYSISYPTEVTIASTWNKHMSSLHGYAISQDGLRNNVLASGWYGPAVNIHRTPFSGRNFEYYSEDSFLSGTMAKEAITSAALNGMYSYIKHFALNDQENHRQDNGLATFANEQAIREIYLKPFQMVFEAGTIKTSYYANNNGKYELKEADTPIAKAVMSSYNRIGYTWSGGDYRLITSLLRNEWGFNGIVLTDYSMGSESYMNSKQMLKAGGDIQLSIYNSVYQITSSVDIYYTKQAMKHVCYTIANSNAMNGYINTFKFVTDGYPIYNLFLIILDSLLVILSTVSITKTIKTIMKE